MQQDGVESLQSDRLLLEEKLCLLIIGRDRSDCGPISFKNCTAGWNMYDPDNVAYLACFLDAAIQPAYYY